MKTYALDLLTLVESLGQQAALLNTPILDTLPGFVGPCRGWVQVQEGAITSCVVEGVNGGRMEGEQALSLVRMLKAWQVTLDAAPPVASVPVAPVAVRPPVLPSLDAVLQRSVPRRTGCRLIACPACALAQKGTGAAGHGFYDGQRAARH